MLDDDVEEADADAIRHEEAAGEKEEEEGGEGKEDEEGAVLEIAELAAEKTLTPCFTRGRNEVRNTESGSV